MNKKIGNSRYPVTRDFISIIIVIRFYFSQLKLLLEVMFKTHFRKSSSAVYHVMTSHH